MNEWTEYSLCVSSSCGVGSFRIDGDTIINNVEYRKLYLENYFYGGVRETKDSLVYYYDAVAYEQEILLYDFAWQVGKQIKSGGFSNISEYVYATIDRIDTLVLENGRKCAYITTSRGTKCIQGIGDVNGFLYPVDYIAQADCEIAHKLWCAIDTKINGENRIIYKDEQCNDCYSCSDNLAVLESNKAISLSPNPVKDILTLSLPSASNEIKIFDLQGKLLLQQNVGFSAEINVSMLQTGTYVLVVNGESYKFVKK
ncbi:MAG: T9SS type A sorting domain-containing protein [Bacteroidales bacterium]|nr:T9SS type A sorting domain-containing protein [Bacteroidales bacterium]